MRDRNLQPYYSSQPLVVPLWIIAACLVLWTVMGGVWFVRAERSLAAVRNWSEGPPPQKFGAPDTERK